MTIVLVDNDRALVQSLSILLKSYGHTVHAFHDPLEAIRFLEGGIPFDLLLLDDLMPGCHGRELLQRMKPRLPRGARVVMISGHLERGKPCELLALGVDAFFPKPLDLDRLVELAGGAADPGARQIA